MWAALVQTAFGGASYLSLLGMEMCCRDASLLRP